MTPTRERLILVGAIGFVILAIVGGYCLAQHTGDTHWMNRAGAAIVTTEGIVIVVEFFRRERLQKVLRTRVTSRSNKPTPEQDMFDAKRVLNMLEGEIRKAESHVMMIAVLLAMTGEILHGFGDLLLQAII